MDSDEEPSAAQRVAPKVRGRTSDALNAHKIARRNTARSADTQLSRHDGRGAALGRGLPPSTVDERPIGGSARDFIGLHQDKRRRTSSLPRIRLQLGTARSSFEAKLGTLFVECLQEALGKDARVQR